MIPCCDVGNRVRGDLVDLVSVENDLCAGRIRSYADAAGLRFRRLRGTGIVVLDSSGARSIGKRDMVACTQAGWLPCGLLALARRMHPPRRNHTEAPDQVNHEPHPGGTQIAR